MESTRVDLWRHQKQLLTYPFEYPQVEFFFLIGGYSCGKTTALTKFVLLLLKKYWGQEMTIGLFAPTIGLLYKTFLIEFERVLLTMAIDYKKDRQRNIVQIGSFTILMFAMDQPELIYGPNISVAVVDEMDEMPIDKVISANMAIQERVRIKLPDGRNPFSVYATTAQGYRGTYQLIEELKKAGIPFIKIRGETKDNKSLPDSYIKRLYALYNENERMAFLEGRFVNLTTGRVYPEFSEEFCVVPSFNPEIHETIYVGQDLNTGYSKAVAMIIRDGKVYAVKDFSFVSIADAPRIIRNSFPQNRILWFPDASAKEIMNAYRQEILSQGIELRMGNVNPPILERIFIKNKLFSLGRLLICDCCQEYIMALKTRCFDKNGYPEKGQGEKSPDHICDSSEYGLFRMVSSEPIFFDIWSLTKGFKGNKE